MTEDILEAALLAAEAKRIAAEAEKAEAERMRAALRVERSAMYRRNVSEIFSAMGITSEITESDQSHNALFTARWKFGTPMGEFRLWVTVDRGDSLDKYLMELVHVEPYVEVRICELYKYQDGFEGRRYNENGRWSDVFPGLLAILGTKIQELRVKVAACRESALRWQEQMRLQEEEKLARQQAEADKVSSASDMADALDAILTDETPLETESEVVEQPKLPKEIQGLVDDLEVLLAGLKNGTWKKLQPHYQAMVHLIRAVNAFADADDDVRYGG